MCINETYTVPPCKATCSSHLYSARSHHGSLHVIAFSVSLLVSFMKQFTMVWFLPDHKKKVSFGLLIFCVAGRGLHSFFSISVFQNLYLPKSELPFE